MNSQLNNTILTFTQGHITLEKAQSEFDSWCEQIKIQTEETLKLKIQEGQDLFDKAKANELERQELQKEVDRLEEESNKKPKTK